MNETFDPITLIIIAAAVVVFFKLRGVLGQKTGHQDPFDPFENTSNRDDKSGDSASTNAPDDNVITMPTNRDHIEQPANTKVDDIPVDDREFADEIGQLKKLDENFDTGHFIEGAKAAYEMIVVEFAQGDKPALKNLLSKDVFAGFADAIDSRKKLGAEMTTQFIGIDEAEISKIDIEGKRAIITVKFISELVSFVRDKKGDVIEGDETDVQEISDVWSFERDLSSRDPNWLLVATDDD